MFPRAHTNQCTTQMQEREKDGFIHNEAHKHTHTHTQTQTDTQTHPHKGCSRASRSQHLVGVVHNFDVQDVRQHRQIYAQQQSMSRALHLTSRCACTQTLTKLHHGVNQRHGGCNLGRHFRAVFAFFLEPVPCFERFVQLRSKRRVVYVAAVHAVEAGARLAGQARDALARQLHSARRAQRESWPKRQGSTRECAQPPHTLLSSSRLLLQLLQPVAMVRLLLACGSGGKGRQVTCGINVAAAASATYQCRRWVG